MYMLSVFNTSASIVYIKLYNKASAPVVGTDVPIWTIPVPASGGFEDHFNIPFGFSTGIAYAITTGVADSDATAVTLNALVGIMLYN